MLRLVLFGCLLLQTLSAWALKPSPTWWAKPDTLGLKYQSLALTTPDHVRLAAWLVAPAAGAPDQHTTMVVAGSDSGNMASFLFQARALAAAGYQVLLFDYRGFGHSQAFAIDQNRLYYEEFATDLGAALAEARRRAPRQRVGILGFSMGTLLGARVAAKDRCDFLITDGYVGNLQAIVAYQATRHKTVTLPAEATSYDPLGPRVKCPWLFIAGTEDRNTPLADSAAAVQAARRGQRRQLLAVPCGHLGAMEELAKTEPAEEYGNAYVRVISRFLAGPPAASKG
ncbi:alpha/beta hydrolase [Hymenobacter nivis]|uniref:Alpha/beta fold hydrolase n=1 Tax=Hymenobacter nivis TaxID=1850093 RepID=A0A502GNZ4_9BACT|nr:alpha/beta fold hydrolase [Hymenobacter nivis]TPG63604.1 alpha/beta fold hydrolase [Hymenobacter nivis]